MSINGWAIFVLCTIHLNQGSFLMRFINSFQFEPDCSVGILLGQNWFIWSSEKYMVLKSFKPPTKYLLNWDILGFMGVT